MDEIGDIFTLKGIGQFASGIKCIVTEVKDGRVTKAKAVIPDPRLAKCGFLVEGEDYVIVEWNWSQN